MSPYPYAPDHAGTDPAVTARQADLRALVSQIPGINRRDTNRYCGCGHRHTAHALHTDDHPCRNCECDTYRSTP